MWSRQEANPHVAAVLAAIMLAFLFLAIFPFTANAVQDDADKMCLPAWNYGCPCGQKCGKDPRPGGLECPCSDKTNGGSVTGTCKAPLQCKGKSFSGAGQSGNAGLDQVMKALGELFGKLMQPPPPSAPPAASPTTPTTNTTGCQGTYFPTSDISLISNPCAQYTPAVSDGILSTTTTTDSGSCSILSQALGLCTNNANNCPTVEVVECTAGNHAVSGGQYAAGCVLADMCVSDTTSPSATSPTSTRTIFATTTNFGGLAVPLGGARGDINVRVDGATVIGGVRDTQNNVEVAGFYGAETFGAQGSQDLVGAWCKARPWSGNFLSKIVAPSFFDGLCTWRGYQVGTPPPAQAPTVTIRQTPKPKPVVPATTTTPTAQAPAATAKVDIWAVPASVPLGARTSIFWNTQGVTSCTETSPNGGFNQSSLSGGAATQPITAATTFSISCLAPDGSPVTGFVTVNLKI